jgi:hypothetical protein
VSILADAQKALTEHLRTSLTKTDPIQSAAPLNPVAGSAYVWPGEPWLAAADDGAFCTAGDATLVADLVAGTAELTHSQAWLADRLEELWLGCARGVDVGVDVITPARADRPALVQTITGATFLVVRVTFTPFRLEI